MHIFNSSLKYFTRVIKAMSTNTNTLDIVKNRLKENEFNPKMQNTNTSTKFNSVNIINEKEFINPKIFPLKRKNSSTSTKLKPSYCDLLNFNCEKYQLPEKFSSEDRSNRIEVNNGGIVVMYVGPGRSDSDAAAIRSNIPVPPQIGIYYFEVKVSSKGREGYIAVGFAIKSASLGRLTGWEPGTIGYHADDGNLYRGAGTGSSFGPSYTTNDVVGCGINFVEKSFFFTKNGILIGEISNLKDKFHLPFFVSVGCRTIGEVLTTNFGADEFVFDIENFINNRLKRNFENTSGQIFNENDLIISYLINSGFKKTCQALLKESSIFNTNSLSISEIELENSFKIAQNRRSVIESIKLGDMENLNDLLKKNFPSFLMENSSIALKLDCLNFIELIRSNIKDIEAGTNKVNFNSNERLKEIFENGKRLTNQFPSEVLKSNSKLLQDTLSLLAYPNPNQSPLAYLLQKSFKNELAEQVDLALLKHEGKSGVSPLHQVLRQCQVVMDELQYMEDSEIALIHM